LARIDTSGTAVAPQVFVGSTLMRFARGAALAGALVVVTTPAHAYSVLGHEATVDALWEPVIAPLLRERFPNLTPEGLRVARAHAYGGSVIQDLGYYPFGNRLFTNIVHYVRSGDFVEALIREANDANEYAFALGALAHYAADNVGHPGGVNRAVPLIYPKMRAEYGDVVTYAQSPKRHIMVEFAFDVVHAASGAYLPASYQDFIGFEVSKSVLERAFRATYGLELNNLFMDLDLAIGTYRYAVTTVVPEVTRVAWREKRKEIEQRTPHVNRDAFIFSYTRHQYEERFGTHYRRPGVLTRILTFLFKILPKVGPLRPLGFEAPTPEAERLFADSFSMTRERYRAALGTVAARRLQLANTDFDTGRPPRRGENALADETYEDLLEKLARREQGGVPVALVRALSRFYTGYEPDRQASRKDRKRAARIRQWLALLRPGI
jgi:hypothetical protein